MKKPAIFKNISDPRLIELLKRGAVGVLPSDTQYGLMTLATIPASVERLYQLKSRHGEPGTLIAAHTQQLVDLGLDAAHIEDVSYLWPGAVSVVLSAGNDLAYLHLGKQSLAVRIPEPADLCELLRASGVLQTSSANLAGQPPAQNIEQAQAYFRDSVDFYVDGGERGEVLPSTVIRIDDGRMTVLRAGAVEIPLS